MISVEYSFISLVILRQLAFVPSLEISSTKKVLSKERKRRWSNGQYVARLMERVRQVFIFSQMSSAIKRYLYIIITIINYQRYMIKKIIVFSFIHL